ncbi:type 4a pilus biogenesis protein PilO [Syntrophothermus lipocalidus]|uniref:Uncharacterized protein n=1 Tax=Syntrophothermus lipocalidus (strain DSM 12680 / TGB-C1) TaxID=643648 RepID=D7CKF4_SYNLT|nr:type 4a pilus biogenesis protein PilO [Syntrophothermus lipocalidus]ADI01189.1 hypothetical protein Slip_0405 [Syntrophothermus lipocalidus DSM 12680]
MGISRIKEFSVLVIVVVSWILFYNCFYQPLREETAKIEICNAGLQKELEKTKAGSDKPSSLQATRTQLAALGQENDAQVPHEPGRDELLLYLTELARASGIRLSKVERVTHVSGKEEPFPSYALRCRLEGKYEDLWSFLQGVETGKRFLSVEKIRLYQQVEANSRRLNLAPSVAERELVPSPGSTDQGEQTDESLLKENYGLMVCECTIVVYFDPSLQKLNQR